MEARNDVRFLELERASSKELRLRLPAWLSARREILGTDAPGERLADPGVRGRQGMAVIEVDRLIAMRAKKRQEIQEPEAVRASSLCQCLLGPVVNKVRLNLEANRESHHQYAKAVASSQLAQSR